jgi:hypothetical protein
MGFLCLSTELLRWCPLQAYTNELENKVARLEEENKRLIELKVKDHQTELLKWSGPSNRFF